MAIILDVKDYCGGCLDFTADVEKPHRMDNFDNDDWSDTVIRCKNRNRCEASKRYLEKEGKNA